jgi:RNA recognition motif-containing protein
MSEEDLYKKRSNKPPTKRLIVRNFPEGTTREELRELGEKFGRVISVGIVSNKPTPTQLTFGFINYLSIDDSAYAQYRLNGYRYYSNELKVDFVNPQKEPEQTSQKGKPKTNRPVKSEEKPKRNKKQTYSLRALTPPNPPTNPLPQQPSVQKTKIENTFNHWKENTSIHSSIGSSGDHPEENGYNTQEKSVYEQQSPNSSVKGKPRYNNNNNRRSEKSNFKKMDEHINPPELVESPTTDTVSSVVEPYAEIPEVRDVLPVTEIQITVNNDVYSLKLGPEQLNEFWKAIEPFSQPDTKFY